MNRVEENEKMIVHFAKSAMETGKGTYEEMVSWQLGAMNSFLMDISKSLAMIADKKVSPTGEEGSE
jgi:hypothetical protein